MYTNKETSHVWRTGWGFWLASMLQFAWRSVRVDQWLGTSKFDIFSCFNHVYFNVNSETLKSSAIFWLPNKVQFCPLHFFGSKMTLFSTFYFPAPYLKRDFAYLLILLASGANWDRQRGVRGVTKTMRIFERQVMAKKWHFWLNLKGLIW